MAAGFVGRKAELALLAKLVVVSQRSLASTVDSSLVDVHWGPADVLAAWRA